MRYLIWLWLLPVVVMAAPIELTFWHSMSGDAGQRMQELIVEFNQHDPDYRVNPVYKGEYPDTLTAFAAAFRARRAPALVQIFDAGTAYMRADRGIIRPFIDIMEEFYQEDRLQITLPVVADYYSHNGRLQALPFNVSIPVLYYNRGMLKNLGIVLDKPLATFDDLEKLLHKVHNAGAKCALTSGWPAWILLESVLGLNGNALIRHNQVLLNTPFMLNHLNLLKRWQQAGLFTWGGRQDDAVALFTSGQCAFFMHSSGTYNSLAAIMAAAPGVMPLPSYARRQQNVPGGAAIWARGGLTTAEYHGIARFFAFILRPAIQYKWHQTTGYLPVNMSALPAEHNVILDIARADLATSGREAWFLPVPNRIRQINDEMLEEIFSGIRTPDQSLVVADKRANKALGRPPN